MTTTKQLDLDNTLLAYLFDPDEGLEAAITDALNAMAGACENLEIIASANNPVWADDANRLEIAEAQLEFYTDVWVKIRATSPSSEVIVETIKQGPLRTEVLDELTADLDAVFVRHYPSFHEVAELLHAKGWCKTGVTPKTDGPLFSERSQLISDISLHAFLTSCGQRKGQFSADYEGRVNLAEDLISRGWHK